MFALTGEISDLELLYAYKAADILYYLQFQKLTHTILEAFYFSLPVISTDISGVRDYFKDYALLVPPQNSEDLAIAMETLLQNPKLREKLGREGKNLIESQFTWDNVANQIEELYNEVLNL